MPLLVVVFVVVVIVAALLNPYFTHTHPPSPHSFTPPRPHSISEMGQFAVRLDGRAILTPAETPLRVPTRALALAVAGEWEAQRERVLPHTMPMMTMCTSVLDELPGKRAVVVANLLAFLKSDTACVRAPDAELAARQDAELGPLVLWFQRRFNVPLTVDNSYLAREQPEDTITVVQVGFFQKYFNSIICCFFILGC